MSRAVTALQICVLMLVLGSNAFAQDRVALPEPDWIPAFSVGMEAFDWKSDETARNLVNGPVWSGDGDDSLRQYLFTLGGELAGPAVKPIPGRPRLFLGGGIGLSIPTADRTLVIGNAAHLTEPERDIGAYVRRLQTAIDRNCLDDPDNPNDVETCPRLDVVDDLDGQGSDVRVSFDTVTWFANLGVSFDVPVLDDALIQIRPSVAYRGERVKVQGRLTTVTLDQFMLPPFVRPVSDTEPAIVETTIHRSRPGAKNSVYHHVGPRLELAVVLSESARPIRTTFFVEGSYLWLVSNPSEHLADTGGVATFSTERHDTAVRGGLGFRFSWVGWGNAN